MDSINAMKVMKSSMTALTWIGLILMFLCALAMTAVAILNHWHWTNPWHIFMITHEWKYRLLSAAWAAYGASILALIGGVITKPPHTWLALIIAGVYWILIMYVNMSRDILGFRIMENLSSNILALIPGILCIISGVIICWYRRQKVAGNKRI